MPLRALLSVLAVLLAVAATSVLPAEALTRASQYFKFDNTVYDARQVMLVPEEVIGSNNNPFTYRGYLVSVAYSGKVFAMNPNDVGAGWIHIAGSPAAMLPDTGTQTATTSVMAGVVGVALIPLRGASWRKIAGIAIGQKSCVSKLVPSSNELTYDFCGLCNTQGVTEGKCAGGEAKFKKVSGMDYSLGGKWMVIADEGDHVIRSIYSQWSEDSSAFEFKSGSICGRTGSSGSGDGTCSTLGAQFNTPISVAIYPRNMSLDDYASLAVFVSERGSPALRKIRIGGALAGRRSVSTVHYAGSVNYGRGLYLFELSVDAVPRRGADYSFSHTLYWYAEFKGVYMFKLNDAYVVNTTTSFNTVELFSCGFPADTYQPFAFANGSMAATLKSSTIGEKDFVILPGAERRCFAGTRTMTLPNTSTSTTTTGATTTNPTSSTTTNPTSTTSSTSAVTSSTSAVTSSTSAATTTTPTTSTATSSTSTGTGTSSSSATSTSGPSATSTSLTSSESSTTASTTTATASPSSSTSSEPSTTSTLTTTASGTETSTTAADAPSTSSSSASTSTEPPTSLSSTTTSSSATLTSTSLTSTTTSSSTTTTTTTTSSSTTTSTTTFLPPPSFVLSMIESTAANSATAAGAVSFSAKAQPTAFSQLDLIAGAAPSSSPLQFQIAPTFSSTAAPSSSGMQVFAAGKCTLAATETRAIVSANNNATTVAASTAAVAAWLATFKAVGDAGSSNSTLAFVAAAPTEAVIKSLFGDASFAELPADQAPRWKQPTLDIAITLSSTCWNADAPFDAARLQASRADVLLLRVVAPPRKPAAAAATTQATTAATQVATLATSLVASPTMATQASRSKFILSLVECTPPLEQLPTGIEHPTGIKIGSSSSSIPSTAVSENINYDPDEDRAAYVSVFVGAACGTPVLFAGLAGLLFTAGLLFGSGRFSLNHGLGFVRFPAMLFVPAVFYVEVVTKQATIGIAFSENGGLIFLSLLALMSFVVALLLWILYRFSGRRMHATLIQRTELERLRRAERRRLLGEVQRSEHDFKAFEAAIEALIEEDAGDGGKKDGALDADKEEKKKKENDQEHGGGDADADDAKVFDSNNSIAFSALLGPDADADGPVAASGGDAGDAAPVTEPAAHAGCLEKFNDWFSGRKMKWTMMPREYTANKQAAAAAAAGSSTTKSGVTSFEAELEDLLVLPSTTDQHGDHVPIPEHATSSSSNDGPSDKQQTQGQPSTTTAEEEDERVENDRHEFHHRYGHIFMEYNDRAPWFAAVELSISLAIGVLEGARVNKTACAVSGILYVVMLAAYLVAILVFQPFFAGGNLLFALTVTVLQLAAGCVFLAAYYGGVSSLYDVSMSLSSASNIIVLLRVVVDLLLALWHGIHTLGAMRVKRLEQRKQRLLETAAADAAASVARREAAEAARAAAAGGEAAAAAALLAQQQLEEQQDADRKHKRSVLEEAQLRARQSDEEMVAAMLGAAAATGMSFTSAALGGAALPAHLHRKSLVTRPVASSIAAAAVSSANNSNTTNNTNDDAVVHARFAGHWIEPLREQSRKLGEIGKGIASDCDGKRRQQQQHPQQQADVDAFMAQLAAEGEEEEEDDEVLICGNAQLPSAAERGVDPSKPFSLLRPNNRRRTKHDEDAELEAAVAALTAMTSPKAAATTQRQPTEDTTAAALEEVTVPKHRSLAALVAAAAAGDKDEDDEAALLLPTIDMEAAVAAARSTRPRTEQERAARREQVGSLVDAIIAAPTVADARRVVQERRNAPEM